MATDTLTKLPILGPAPRSGPDFQATLAEHGLAPLVREQVKTLQVNVGKRCNQACHHCHVEAGPKRTEIMPRYVAQRIIGLLAASPAVETVDLTGGAPELNPNFRFLVTQARRLGRHVIDRCNLTVFFEPGMEDLPGFLAENEVEVIASLPCYIGENVDKQRGRGVFKKSIKALQLLNRLGYGRPGSRLALNLVYNPLGAFLPPRQEVLEQQYTSRLREQFGVEFHRLFTLTNMPIKRFASYLDQTGQYEAYMSLLVNHFNPGTVSQLMCRSLVSVGWDGKLYDCDFNQMLEIGLGAGQQMGARTAWDINSFWMLSGARIATAVHCFGCTANAGSGCGGVLQ